MKKVIIGCLVMALIAAIFYFLMAAGVITVPSLNRSDAPATIVYTAAGCYFPGGFLILLKKRWLWTIGLVMNTLVIGIFIMMYYQKPEVMFSLPGLGTKIPQIVLEAGLIYLIANHRKKNTTVFKAA